MRPRAGERLLGALERLRDMIAEAQDIRAVWFPQEDSP
jgi:hypothetical protein